MVSTLRAKSQSFRQSPMPSTYAITGSNGFIAAHLIQDLTAQGHTVLGIVRDAKAYSEQVGALGAKVVEVPSLDDSAALVKALAGVDGLFHMAAVECGNDSGTLTETMWSKPEVYDLKENLETQWATHYTYVKSKVEQEKAAVDFAQKNGLDLRVVVPGNLCIGPIASANINGTMTRLKDIVSGTNTLKGAADLAIVHVGDVAAAH